VEFETVDGANGPEARSVAVVQSRCGHVSLMARRSAQSVLKRAREQAMREKRERKQAKKDARAAERRREGDPPATAPQETAEGDSG
jgi:hypothetical protein